MPRPPRCRRICSVPQAEAFGPLGCAQAEPILLSLDEYEVIRLVDLEGQTHEQCAVAAAIGIHYFCVNDLTVNYFINLELCRVAKMLKNLSVFIGNCDFHGVISFLCRVGLRCSTAPCRASAFAMPMLLPAANAVVAAGDAKGLCIHKARCDFAPCAFINFLYGRTRNIHLCSALLVGLPLKID